MSLKKKKLDIQYINTNYNQYQFQNKSTTITKSQQQSTITKNPLQATKCI